LARKSGGALDAFAWFLSIFKPEQVAYKNNARNALTKLCHLGRKAEKGFDPGVLGDHLRDLLDSNDIDKIFEPLLRYGQGSSQRLTMGDLDAIAGRARKLRIDILELRRTPLMLELVLPPGDLLNSYSQEHNAAGGDKVMEEDDDPPDDDMIKDDSVMALNTLLNLPTIARSKPKKKTRLAHESLWTLCRYVKATTGRWNYANLAAILGPMGIPYCQSEGALKVWRNRTAAILRRRSSQLKK
jgi:hypothetical protein